MMSGTLILVVTLLEQIIFVLGKTYYLSDACRNPSVHDPLKLYPNTKHLIIDNLNESLILYSHEGVISNRDTHRNITMSYPRGFSCEVVVSTGVPNAKIMLKVDYFFIPSPSNDCVDDYLYVFDSNNAKAKAMPEAGGERGLCQSTYPRVPIFTTNPFVCFAFHTSTHPSMIPPHQQSPGFRLVLTPVLDTMTGACPSSSFYCGLRPSVNVVYPEANLPDRLPYVSDTGSITSHATDLSLLGYCILPRSVCDGISNCMNNSDEDLEYCTERGWLSGFLSLGIPASIAIAVSTIITFTFCIGTVVCCCHRCCCKSKYRTTGAVYPRAHLQQNIRPTLVAQTFSKHSFEELDRWLDSRHQQPTVNCPPGVHPTQPSMGYAHMSHMIGHTGGLQPNVQPSSASTRPQYHSSRQEAEFTFTHSSQLQGNFQTSLSSPDHLTLDSCSYTPPPYGACLVPPASSASSRTGTASANGWKTTDYFDQSRQSNRPDLSAHGTAAVPNGSNGMLLGQQLGGSRHSALHTNTPVEAISQCGADLSLNGGILYLGDVSARFSNKDLTSCDNGALGCPGSTTTGSGSSRGPRYNRTHSNEASHRRRSGRARSHRHNRYRQSAYQAAVASTRTASSGSQTPASSRSGLPLSLRSVSDTTDANFRGPLPSSASFSVQL